MQFGASFGNPLVQGLPPMLLMALAEVPTMAGVREALFAEAFVEHVGREAALDRLNEVVLIHLLRHIVERGLLKSGVMVGLADGRLAKALGAMHAEPAKPWTLQALAGM